MKWDFLAKNLSGSPGACLPSPPLHLAASAPSPPGCVTAAAEMCHAMPMDPNLIGDLNGTRQKMLWSIQYIYIVQGLTSNIMKPLRLKRRKNQLQKRRTEQNRKKRGSLSPNSMDQSLAFRMGTVESDGEGRDGSHKSFVIDTCGIRPNR